MGTRDLIWLGGRWVVPIAGGGGSDAGGEGGGDAGAGAGDPGAGPGSEGFGGLGGNDGGTGSGLGDRGPEASSPEGSPGGGSPGSGPGDRGPEASAPSGSPSGQTGATGSGAPSLGPEANEPDDAPGVFGREAGDERSPTSGTRTNVGRAIRGGLEIAGGAALVGLTGGAALGPGGQLAARGVQDLLGSREEVERGPFESSPAGASTTSGGILDTEHEPGLSVDTFSGRDIANPNREGDNPSSPVVNVPPDDGAGDGDGEGGEGGEGGDGGGGDGTDIGLPDLPDLPPVPDIPLPAPIPQFGAGGEATDSAKLTIDRAQRFGRESTLLTGAEGVPFNPGDTSTPGLTGNDQNQNPVTSEPALASREGTRRPRTVTDDLDRIDRENQERGIREGGPVQSFPPSPPTEPTSGAVPEVRSSVTQVRARTAVTAPTVPAPTVTGLPFEKVASPAGEAVPEGYTLVRAYATMPYQAVRASDGSLWIRDIRTGEMTRDGMAAPAGGSLSGTSVL